MPRLICTLYKGNGSTVYWARQQNGHACVVKIVRLCASRTTDSVGPQVGHHVGQQEMAVYNSQLSHERIFLARLRNESRVINLIKARQSPRNLCLVLEAAPRTLRSFLRNRQLEPADIVHWFCEVLQTCAAIHAHNIVHADLKPQNLVVFEHCRQIKAIDFGAAVEIPYNQREIKREVLMITPNFAAPECLERVDGGWRVGFASDVYSCGCIGYEILHGLSPLQAAAKEFYGKSIDKLPNPNHSETISMIQSCIPLLLRKNQIRQNHALKAMMELVHSMLSQNPNWRPSAEQATRLMQVWAAGENAASSAAESLVQVRPHPGHTRVLSQ